jgi:hypothetical protein
MLNLSYLILKLFNIRVDVKHTLKLNTYYYLQAKLTFVKSHLMRWLDTYHGASTIKRKALSIISRKEKRKIGPGPQKPVQTGRLTVGQIILTLITSGRCCSGVVRCFCVKLVTVARGQFGNPQEGERPPMKTVTRQRQ